jgi:SAM-dependent methyltransferase
MKPAESGEMDWGKLDIRPDERVLLLTIPSHASIAELSEKLERGLVVALGEAEEVARARRALRERRNVMFHPGPQDEVPFEDGFFTRIIDFSSGRCEPERVAKEIARSLAPGGKAYLRVDDATALTAAGLVETAPSAASRAFEKP